MLVPLNIAGQWKLRARVNDTTNDSCIGGAGHPSCIFDRTGETSISQTGFGFSGQFVGSSTNPPPGGPLTWDGSFSGSVTGDKATIRFRTVRPDGRNFPPMVADFDSANGGFFSGPQFIIEQRDTVEMVSLSFTRP